MIIKKYLYSFCFLLFQLPGAGDGWVEVPRQERVVHEISGEDRSIWVVFAKKFENERILVRFPQEPTVTHADDHFNAIATLGDGELTLTVRKKEQPDSKPKTEKRNISYRDSETSLLVRELHIETESHFYVLRSKHSSESSSLYQSFFESFEIERPGEFKRC
jgi:hypothetical protein